MKRNLWRSWTDYLNINSTDTLEEVNEKVTPQIHSDVMKLKLKDMNLFGYCSEYDDFYLVICHICGKSIKPQSLNLHIEFRHKINFHKLSLSGALQQSSLLTYLLPNCSNESSKHNDDRLSKIKNSAICSLSGTKHKLKFMSNKKQAVYVQPYPRPSSINSCHKKNAGKFPQFSTSSDMIRTAVAKSITPENNYFESLKSDTCVEKASSSSTCDSQTSMTVFLHHSFVMPNIKLCDIKNPRSNYLQCLSSKALPKRNCLSKTTILTKVLPGKSCRQNVRSSRQGSQVHFQSKEVDDWNSLENSTNLGLNRVSYTAWNQHSSHFHSLPQDVPVGNNGQMNSHSFNCSDLTKGFGDLESQVLIHNTAMSM